MIDPPAPGGAKEQPMTTDGEIHCRTCGVDIRLIDGHWLDRETYSHCDRTRKAIAHGPADQTEDLALVTALSAIVREADEVFERSGGSSRHWVRDCFLPVLNRAGWQVSK